MIAKYIANISNLLVIAQNEYAKLYDLLRFIKLQLESLITYLENQIEFNSYVDLLKFTKPAIPNDDRARLYYDTENHKIQISEDGNRFDNLRWDGYYFSRLIDEFVDDDSGGTPGNLRWQVTSGTSAKQGAVRGHPGITRLTSGAVSGNRAAMFLFSGVDNDQIDRITFLIHIPTTVASLEAYIGIGTTASADYLGTESICFAYVGGNWICVARTASANTTIDSGVAVAADTWYKLELISEGGTTVSGFTSANEWGMYINDVFVGFLTTGLPAVNTALGPCVSIQTNTAAAREIDIDTFIEDFKNLGFRY